MDFDLEFPYMIMYVYMLCVYVYIYIGSYRKSIYHMCIHTYVYTYTYSDSDYIRRNDFLFNFYCTLPCAILVQSVVGLPKCCSLLNGSRFMVRTMTLLQHTILATPVGNSPQVISFIMTLRCTSGLLITFCSLNKFIFGKFF